MSSKEREAEWLDADEIKRTVNVPSVLQRHGLWDTLKVANNRGRGLSPFRQETKPSFSIDITDGRWQDFGGMPLGIDNQPVKGNVVGLEMALSRCSFRQALKNLLTDCNIESDETTAPREIIKEVVIPPNTPFNKKLRGLRTNIPYFQNKGINEETAKFFECGFYNGPGLMRHFIVFPIKNVEGVIMSYIGRAIKVSQDPFKIPPEFYKSRELFNIERLFLPEVQPVVAAYGVILVEGFSDVLRLWQNGFPNVVSTIGSSFSRYQLDTLLDPDINPTRRFTLFYDEDEAGIKGKRAAAKMLVHQDAWYRNVDYTRVPTGERVESPTEPEHFTAQELSILLGQEPVQTPPL